MHTQTQAHWYTVHTTDEDISRAGGSLTDPPPSERHPHFIEESNYAFVCLHI